MHSNASWRHLTSMKHTSAHMYMDLQYIQISLDPKFVSSPIISTLNNILCITVAGWIFRSLFFLIIYPCFTQEFPDCIQYTSLLFAITGKTPDKFNCVHFTHKFQCMIWLRNQNIDTMDFNILQHKLPKFHVTGSRFDRQSVQVQKKYFVAFCWLLKSIYN